MLSDHHQQFAKLVPLNTENLAGLDTRRPIWCLIQQTLYCNPETECMHVCLCRRDVNKLLWYTDLFFGMVIFKHQLERVYTEKGNKKQSRMDIYLYLKAVCQAWVKHLLQTTCSTLFQFGLVGVEDQPGWWWPLCIWWQIFRTAEPRADGHTQRRHMLSSSGVGNQTMTLAKQNF